jgi:formylmethanofuran dehydrogenase subunit E-like metal-binding protein
MSQVMIVMSKMSKNKNILADVKKVQKMFWDDADVMATEEVQVITTKKWADKYKDELQKLADEKGYQVEVIEAPEQ